MILALQEKKGVLRSHKQWHPASSSYVDGALFERFGRNALQNSSTNTGTLYFATTTTAGNPLSPNGVDPWIKLIENTSNVYHRSQHLIYYCDPYKMIWTSIYARAGERGWLSVQTRDIDSVYSGYSIFNLTTGAIEVSATEHTIHVHPAPDGTGKIKGEMGWTPTWQIIVGFSSNGTTNNTTRVFYEICKGPTIADRSYLGDGVSGLYYFWPHAQRGQSLALPIYSLGNNAIGTGKLTTEGTEGVYGTGRAADPPMVSPLPTAKATPQPMEYAFSIMDMGLAFSGVTSGLFSIGNAGQTGARWGIRTTGTAGQCVVFHHNGTTEVTAAIPATFNQFSRYDITARLAANGSVSCDVAVDGGALVPGTPSAANALAAQWGEIGSPSPFLWLGGLGCDQNTTGSFLLLNS